MPVSSNAAPDERDSPHFIANEKFCKSFDEFIVANNGETRGSYNAWSYNVLGKVRHPNKWEFRIKKSTFTSGNLLLSSEYQNLHVASIWTAQKLNSECEDFYIRKKKFIDTIRVLLSSKWNWLSNDKQYVVKSKSPNCNLIIDLKTKLKSIIEYKRVWEITYKNSVLSIDLRSDSSHFLIIEKLLAENYA